MWRCDNVGDLSEHVKKTHVVVSYVYLFCFMLRLTPSAHTWSDFDDLYVIRRVSAQDVPFGGLVHTAPYFGAKI